MLQTLRCIGHSSAGRLATASRLGDDRTTSLLERLRGRGLVSEDEGPFGGWSLTLDGRDHVEGLVQGELAASGARPAILESYRAFLPLNQLAMDVFHAWQMRDIAGTHIVNDHSDAIYDDEVLQQLSSLDEKAQGLLADLAAQVSRFAGTGQDSPLPWPRHEQAGSLRWQTISSRITASGSSSTKTCSSLLGSAVRMSAAGSDR